MVLQSPGSPYRPSILVIKASKKKQTLPAALAAPKIKPAVAKGAPLRSLSGFEFRV